MIMFLYCPMISSYNYYLENNFSFSSNSLIDVKYLTDQVYLECFVQTEEEMLINQALHLAVLYAAWKDYFSWRLLSVELLYWKKKKSFFKKIPGQIKPLYFTTEWYHKDGVKISDENEERSIFFINSTALLSFLLVMYNNIFSIIIVICFVWNWVYWYMWYGSSIYV